MISEKNIPFLFGKIAAKAEFTNRARERKQLKTNFVSGTNTIMISPRRWGKSSLVKQVALDLKSKKQLKISLLDLFNVKTEEEFYKHLTTELLKSSASKMEELFANAKQLLGNLIPRISFGTDATSEISVSMDWQQVVSEPNDVLDLAEKIAIKNNCKIVVCIDEFQNISSFSDPVAFQKKLRARWQHHEHVTYCLYGSKRHMMIELFASPSMPFYKFGEVIFLDKIKTNDWVKFIVKRFKDTGKAIKSEQAKKIAILVENHPYYVQQLAQQCWLRTQTQCDDNIINQSFESLTLQLSLLFQNLTDGLKNTQVNYLKALLNNEQKMSAKLTLAKYQLGTSANVIRIKKTLESKEIIDTVTGQINFLDPVYKHWLSTYYFNL